MRTFISYSLLIVVALNVFGHAGEVHKYMGTVTALNDDGSFTLKKTDGATMNVELSNATVYQHADGRMANRAELGAGTRVVVTISTDGKTASMVKFAAKKK
jgi:hypothetical protein